jgi:hypothetical protein
MTERRPVPVLAGWSSLPDAARKLRVTRQRLFQMGAEEDKLVSMRAIPGAGTRPSAYVVGDAEVCRLRRAQLTGEIRAVDTDIAAAERAEVHDAKHLAALREELADLQRQLEEVQLDALALLHVQLALAAEAAETAGNEELAGLLREHAEVRAAVAA